LRRQLVRSVESGTRKPFIKTKQTEVQQWN
jgi:hypothetical protein